MKKLNTRLVCIDPNDDVSGPHEIDPAKVNTFMQAMIAGDEFPPVRLVYYNSGFGTPFYQIIDGHHRAEAAQTGEFSFNALVADGDEFEELDIELRTAGDGKRADDIEFWTATDFGMECACGEREHIAETIEEDTFPVGAAPDPVIDVTCEVPVLTCLKCGFQWTDYRAEEIRDKAAREQTPYFKEPA